VCGRDSEQRHKQTREAVWENHSKKIEFCFFAFFVLNINEGFFFFLNKRTEQRTEIEGETLTVKDLKKKFLSPVGTKRTYNTLVFFFLFFFLLDASWILGVLDVALQPWSWIMLLILGVWFFFHFF